MPTRAGRPPPCRPPDAPWIPSWSSTPVPRASNSRCSRSKPAAGCRGASRARWTASGPVRGCARAGLTAPPSSTGPLARRKSPMCRRRCRLPAHGCAKITRSSRSRSAIGWCTAGPITTGRWWWTTTSSNGSNAMFRSRRCTSRTILPPSARSARAFPTCRRSPVSTPPSIAATAPSLIISPFPNGSIRRACAATASMAFRTNISRTACVSSRRRSPPER